MPNQQAFQSGPWGLPPVWSCYLKLKGMTVSLAD